MNSTLRDFAASVLSSRAISNSRRRIGASGIAFLIGMAALAMFAPKPAEAQTSTLTVTLATNNVNGRVVSSPAGIDCTSTCSASFPSGTVVDLYTTDDSYAAPSSSNDAANEPCGPIGMCATGMSGELPWAKSTDPANPQVAMCIPTHIFCASTNSNFAGWGGACTGTSACRITMGSNQSVSATFGNSLPAPPPSTAAKNLGAPNDVPGGCACGEPINVATGNLYESVIDYESGGQNQLRFARYYNSLQASNNSGTYAQSLGVNWRSTYDRYLNIVSSGGAVATVYAERPDGQVLTFTPNGSGGFSTDTDVDVTLTQSGTAWTLTDHDDAKETYSAESSGEALLASIVARNGYTQNLSYNSSNQLQTVTDSYNRTLTFTYSSNGLLNAVTTPGGLVLTYGYSSSGVTPGVYDQLASVSYSASPATSQTYTYANSSFPFALTNRVDEDGITANTWVYNSAGQAISSQLATVGGQQVDYTRLVYNSDGTVTVTSPLGEQETYTFTTLQNVPKITGISRATDGDVAAATRTFTYDDNGYIASATDWNGNTTAYVNDGHGDPTSITQASGTGVARTTAIAYGDASFPQLPTTITEPTRTITNAYDGDGATCSANGNTGDLCASTAADTLPTGYPPRTWAYTWNATGEELTAKGPRTDVNQTTTMTYDAAGNPKTVTNALGQTTSLNTYNNDGRLLTATDPNGLGIVLTWDARGQLISRTLGSETLTLTRDATETVTNVTDPDGSAFALGRDDAHRLISVTDNLGNPIKYTLDAAGNRTAVSSYDASGSLVYTHSNAYDALNRIAQSIGALDQTTGYQYDSNSNLLTVTDPLGEVTQVAYDALNREVSSTDPTGATTSLGYDAADDLTQVTDPRNLQTQYGYDGLGDQVRIASPDTGAIQTAYDRAGNALQRSDANGRLASPSYDALDRPIQTRYAGTVSTGFSYDQGPNGLGHLTSMTDASGSTAWTYDQQGHVLTKTQSVGANKLVVQYAYDSAGRLVSITYPSGAVVQYTYNTNLVTAISINGSPVLSGVTYQAFQGPPNGWTWGNGTTYQRSFDTDARLAAYPLGARTRELSFDLASRITGYGDSAPAYSQSFAYDKASRLTGYTAATGGEQYGYDADGNRTSLTTSFPGASNLAYNYSASSNQLDSAATGAQTTTYGYDPTGNTTGDGTNVFTYDGRNRLIAVSNAQGFDYYAINGLGERVAKLSGPPANLAGDANRDGVINATDLRLTAQMATGQIPVDLAADCNQDGQVTTADVACEQAKMANMRTNPQSYVNPAGTTFAYDEAGHLIGEYNGTTPIEETIYLGDTPVATLVGGSIYYIYADHLNAPRVIVNGSNTPVWDWEGAPFGDMPANQNPSGLGTFVYNLRFPGQYYDAETGLHYNMARDYNSATGRYVESDPTGLAGGINAYAYASSSPTLNEDPTGESLASEILESREILQSVGGQGMEFAIARASNSLGICPEVGEKVAMVVPVIFEVAVLESPPGWVIASAYGVYTVKTILAPYSPSQMQEAPPGTFPTVPVGNGLYMIDEYQMLDIQQ